MSQDMTEIEGVPAEIEGSAGGATAEALAALEKWVGRKLPDVYTNLLRRKNGFQAYVSTDFSKEIGGYFILDSAEEVPVLNEGNNVPDLEPGRLMVGSDGGNEVYLIELVESADQEPQWFEVPRIDLGRPSFCHHYANLETLLKDLAARDYSG
jgi:hypothetical protein